MIKKSQEGKGRPHLVNSFFATPPSSLSSSEVLTFAKLTYCLNLP
jgi:hypothetical protein